jgi:hypothetical protein
LTNCGQDKFFQNLLEAIVDEIHNIDLDDIDYVQARNIDYSIVHNRGVEPRDVHGSLSS